MSRVRGVIHTVPIVYGSQSFPILKPESEPDPTHSHKWKIFVKGTGKYNLILTTNKPKLINNLFIGLNGSDISCVVKKVVFKLHESFTNPTRCTQNTTKNNMKSN